MLPVLRYVADRPNESVLIRDLFAVLAKEFALTDDDLREMLPSGATTTFGSRVSWSCTYLKKAGLLSSPKRGCVKITQRGLEVLAKRPKTINTTFLKQYPEFQAFQAKGKNSEQENDAGSPDVSLGKTPHEAIESVYQKLRAQLADELLETVKSCPPAFFERLVVDLLVKMGYGGSLADAVRAVGKSGDGGIDGIIKEDKLGLDVIYIQAKRWDLNSVGRPQVQQFAGALQGQRAAKGIFITTSNFTDDARNFVGGIGSKIVLVDGDELAKLMIDNGIGVTTVATYEVRRIDSDYFAESE
jgi:restriction system protein